MTGPRRGRLELDTNAVVWREVDEEIIVLELSTAVYLTVNGSACPLWLRLTHGATADELASVLVEEYAITLERAAADVDAFLDALAARSLLRASESEARLDPAG
ncbi:MAG TPA: PqqD family protein [Acidimicrobiales bacterium]|nr:PqqD family protein [Acidimicrobiales bacterium]